MQIPWLVSINSAQLLCYCCKGCWLRCVRAVQSEQTGTQEGWGGLKETGAFQTKGVTNSHSYFGKHSKKTRGTQTQCRPAHSGRVARYLTQQQLYRWQKSSLMYQSWISSHTNAKIYVTIQNDPSSDKHIHEQHNCSWLSETFPWGVQRGKNLTHWFLLYTTGLCYFSYLH